jgi:hypothetical protein
MSDPAQLARIQAEIDGDLDERGRAALARDVLADPALRQMRDEFRRLAARLDEVKMVEPPPELADGVRTAVQHAAPPPVEARRVARAWRYAAVVVVGLGTGAIMYAIVGTDRPPASELAGTLAPPRNAQVLDTVQLPRGPVAGRVSLLRDGAKLALSLELEAGAPVDVVVASGGHTLRLEGVGGAEHGRAGRTTVALADFGGDGQAVNLLFLVADQEVGRATLRPPAGR